jgi:hypothetical protein
MIEHREHNNTVKVEDYGLAEWLAQVYTLIKQGYEFDFTSNETYPLVFGSMYTVVMVKSKEQAVEVDNNGKEVTTGETTVVPKETSLIGEQAPEVDFRSKEHQVLPRGYEQPVTLENNTPTKVDGRKKKS